MKIVSMVLKREENGKMRNYKYGIPEEEDLFSIGTYRIGNYINTRDEKDALAYLLNHSKRHRPKCIKSGFKCLDEILFGFHDGDLIVLAGGTLTRKTSLILNIMLNVALRDTNPMRAGFFFLEGRGDEVAERMICMESGYGRRDFLNGSISDVEKMNMVGEAISKAPIFINAGPESILTV